MMTPAAAAEEPVTWVPVTRVPLDPFDSPEPRCVYKVYDLDGDEHRCGQPEGAEVHKLVHDYEPSPYVQRRAGSKDDRIKPERNYLAKCNGEWRLGQFEEQWYGWNFWDGGSGHQLDGIEDLYEIDLERL